MVRKAKPHEGIEHVALTDRSFTIEDGLFVYDTALEDDTGINDDGFHWPAVGRGQTMTRAAHIFRYMQLMRLTKGKGTVLDAACGYAELARLMYTNMYGARYVGMDIHGKKLRSAIKTGWGSSETMFIQRDLSRPLPFDDATFDTAVSSEFIEHIPPSMAVGFLAEVARVTKPGGRIIVTTPNGRFQSDNPHHIKEYTIPEMRTLLEGTGSRIVKVYGYTLGSHIRVWDKEYKGVDSPEAKQWRALRDSLPPSWVKAIWATTRPNESSFVTYVCEPE